MATGASNSDVAIILIDAQKGVLEQTRRHSFIVNLLGIKHVVVAINKMDLVNFNEKVFDLFSKVHYGHFDYCLDSELWPFQDPYHTEYWNIITKSIV